METVELAAEILPRVTKVTQIVSEHIRDGRFQRSMALLTAGSSLISGLEVGYEHYKGSYSNPIMYTPVALSGVLTGASLWGAFSERAARTVMRAVAFTTLADGLIGFGFHVRGIHRKPGGWRLPITNIVMGPPIFAPLLFGTAAYLGFMASYLRREEDGPKDPATNGKRTSRSRYKKGWRRELHHGKFQKHLAGVAAAWAIFSGFEAWYSHYKNNFRVSWAQWTPVLLAPVQTAACIAAIYHEGSARKLLPATSALAVVDGAVGFGYHVRGILRRPGGKKHWLYNILYGPPVFAPLLFAACGALGILASLLRREGATDDGREG